MNFICAELRDTRTRNIFNIPPQIDTFWSIYSRGIPFLTRKAFSNYLFDLFRVILFLLTGYLVFLYGTK